MSTAQQQTQTRRRLQLLILLIGLGAAATTGPTGTLIALGAALCALAGCTRTNRRLDVETQVWMIANVIALFISIAMTFFLPMLTVAVAFVCWLMLHRAWTAETTRDARIMVLLALLQLLLASILSISILLSLLFTGFAVIAPLLLLQTHLEDGMPQGTQRADRDIGTLWMVSPAILVLTVFFFLTIPRFTPGGFGPGRREVLAGFSQQMTLGELGTTRENPQIVLRAIVNNSRGESLAGPFYFRGASLELFDGQQWSSQNDGTINRVWWNTKPEPGEEVLTQTITQYDIDGGVLLTIPTASSVRAQGLNGSLDSNGDWILHSQLGEIEATVQSIVRDPRQPRPFSKQMKRTLGYRVNDTLLRSGVYTYIPEQSKQALLPIVQQFTAELPEDASQVDRALAITRGLNTNFTYSDAPQEPTQGNPLDDFLFRSRTGNCEYFATALAVMLRSQEIPSRVVTGFYGGEWNEFGQFIIVRQSNAHAWVEAWFPDRGWIMLDGTTEVEVVRDTNPIFAITKTVRDRWERLILDYSILQQLRGARGIFRFTQRLASGGGGDQTIMSSSGIRAAGTLIGLLVMLSLCVRISMRWMAGEVGTRDARLPPVGRIHRLARGLVSLRGWEPPSGLPPAAAADWLLREAGVGVAPLSALTWLMYSSQYGGQSTGTEWRDGLRHLYALWRELPKRRR